MTSLIRFPDFTFVNRRIFFDEINYIPVANTITFGVFYRSTKNNVEFISLFFSHGHFNDESRALIYLNGCVSREPR